MQIKERITVESRMQKRSEELYLMLCEKSFKELYKKVCKKVSKPQREKQCKKRFTKGSMDIGKDISNQGTRSRKESRQKCSKLQKV